MPVASGDEVPSTTLRAGLRYAQDDRYEEERTPSKMVPHTGLGYAYREAWEAR